MFFSKSSMKLVSMAFMACSLAVGCNKSSGNSVAGGVKINSVTSGGASTTGYSNSGSTALTVSVSDGSGQAPQTYVLNASIGVINGDLRQIGQFVYELQTTCANANCTDVAFMIIQRQGFAGTTGTYNSYLGTNPLAGDGVNYPNSASSYSLTTQPMGSVEFLYRATGSPTGINWVLMRELSDSTGAVTILSTAQITALEQP